MSRALSAYARQFLELMQKPDVDHIEGLSPAISIEQKTTSRNPRSTVATVTEIYDYMRLLWARVGVPYSPETGLPIAAQTVSQMVDRVMALPEGTRLYLLAPVVRGRKGEYRKEMLEWQKAGFTRVRIDGELYEIDEAPALDKKYKHDIEVVVDRLVSGPSCPPASPTVSRPRSSWPRGWPYVDLVDGVVPGREAESRRRRRDEGRGRARQPHRVQRKIRLPRLGLHHRRDRAAAVQLQRPAGRVPGVRRPGRKDDLRRGPRRPQPRPHDQEGRDRALGEIEPAQPLLHASPRQPGARIRVQPRHQMGRRAAGDPRRHPPRHQGQARSR